MSTHPLRYCATALPCDATLRPCAEEISKSKRRRMRDRRTAIRHSMIHASSLKQQLNMSQTSDDNITHSLGVGEELPTFASTTDVVRRLECKLEKFMEDLTANLNMFLPYATFANSDLISLQPPLVHGFPANILAEQCSSARTIQRAFRRGSLRGPANKSEDVFELLASMAALATPVCGAVVFSNASEIYYEQHGNSLHYSRLEKDATHAEFIRSVKDICKDDSWMLQVGDIVYVGEQLRPFQVFRIGWGDYEREVRVARLSDDLRRHETGQWVRTDACYKLEVGDSLEAMREIQDAMVDPVMIPKGTRCQLIGWDDDGDLKVKYGGRQTVLFRADLDALSLI